MGRHLRKIHIPDRPSPQPSLEMLYTAVSLQTWNQPTATQSYWVIPSERDAPDQVVSDDTSHSTANSKFLHDLRQRESRFQFKQLTNIRMPVLLIEQLPMREPDPSWTGHGGLAHIKEFHAISESD
jgi:hypothetical protein